MVRSASEELANTVRELGHEAHVRISTDAAAAPGLALRNGSASCLAAAETEKPGAQDRADPWHSQSRGLMKKTPGWKAFDDVVRLVEHQTHQRATEFNSKSDIGH